MNKPNTSQSTEAGVAAEKGGGSYPPLKPGKVLVADADEELRRLLTEALTAAGLEVSVSTDGQETLDALAVHEYDVVLLDLDLPGVSGAGVLAARPAVQTDAVFIALTGHDAVESTVEALRLGAFDVLRRPCKKGQMFEAVSHALAEVRWRRESGATRGQPATTELPGLIGRTPEMQRLARLILRVAPTRASVLITGETGTGKEVVARAIHEASPRAGAKFVAVHCSAIPETLLEAELFGHAKGSFTGAIRSRRGLIEEAEGGTLFLDEVSTLSADVQVKLLRVLDDRRVQRVGANASTSVDFRLIAATNEDLQRLVAQGLFREDLLYRLDVVPLAVPPLRHHAEDIPLLAMHFMSRYAEEHDLAPPRLSSVTLSRMMSYTWPGNVRELENFIERSVIMYSGQEYLPFDLACGAEDLGPADTLGRALAGNWTLERLEREYLLETLERYGGQRNVTADALGVNRRTIHRKLERYKEQGLLDEKPGR